MFLVAVVPVVDSHSKLSMDLYWTDRLLAGPTNELLIANATVGSDKSSIKYFRGSHDPLISPAGQSTRLHIS